MSNDIPMTTSVLSDLEKEAIDAEFTAFEGSPANRVIELLNQKAPQLLEYAPLILALCELYHQRRLISSGSAQNERLKKVVGEMP